MVEVQKLSQEAFDRMKAEFEDLTSRGRIEIAKKIETARELGDLSENGDYHAAKEEQGKMEGRIGSLGAMISNAEIVKVDTSSQVVQPGAIVCLRYEGDDDVEKFLIGHIEEKIDDIDVMSPGSPLGQTLLGAKKGDTVEFDSPAGPLKVEVVDIEFR